VVDHDHAPAERDDVGHVVAREQDGRLVAAVVLGDERADPPLHRHVQADCGLVEEEDLRAVNERAHDFDLHALAEREVPHRLADEVADVEQLDQLVAQLREVGPGNSEDRAIQFERVERGQIPLQLVAVPHHERDLSQVVALALGGDVSEHQCVAGGRIEQSRQHLQRRRLAGAVRAEEADDLSRLDLERDAVDGAHLSVTPPDKGSRGRGEARLPFGDAKDLRQLGDVDDRHQGEKR
jgi:hypothetical protein